MWHWLVEAVEAALLGGLAAMSWKQHRKAQELHSRVSTDRELTKRLYEKNSRRWSDHVRSRMH